MRLLTYARSRHRAVLVTLGPIALGIVLGLCGTSWAQCITQETAKLLASDRRRGRPVRPFRGHQRRCRDRGGVP